MSTKWTEEENEILRINYPKGGTNVCLEKVNRSRNAIVQHAAKLGLKANYVHPFKNIEGQMFGDLLVLGLSEPPPNVTNTDVKYWRCLCVCGEEVVVRGTSLRYGSIKSCGCSQKKERTSFVGKRLGKIRVLSRAKNYCTSSGHTSVQYNCRCSCGNEFVMRKSALREGARQCQKCALRRGASDLTGKVFGELTVVERAPNQVFSSGREVTAWLCRCSCRELIAVTSTNLKSGSTRSCGCKSIEWNSGENNRNWKGGRTPLYVRLRNCQTNQQWKQEVLERDAYTCTKCGDAQGHNLNVHHIKPFAKILDEFEIDTYTKGLNCNELWDIENGVTLCEDCHKEIHSVFGSNYSKNVFWNWFREEG